MFNLDTAIGEWRRQMGASGIKDRPVLDELESHLRDEWEEQMRAGSHAEQAFAIAAQRLGQPATLECEFEKVRQSESPPERMKEAFFALAGIPNQLSATMNTTKSNLEPRDRKS